jgi:hypothetical protein
MKIVNSSNNETEREEMGGVLFKISEKRQKAIFEL